jgi:hypothetical protein
MEDGKCPHCGSEALGGLPFSARLGRFVRLANPLTFLRAGQNAVRTLFDEVGIIPAKGTCYSLQCRSCLGYAYRCPHCQQLLPLQRRAELYRDMTCSQCRRDFVMIT